MVLENCPLAWGTSRRGILVRSWYFSIVIRHLFIPLLRGSNALPLPDRPEIFHSGMAIMCKTVAAPFTGLLEGHQEARHLLTFAAIEVLLLNNILTVTDTPGQDREDFLPFSIMAKS